MPIISPINISIFVRSGGIPTVLAPSGMVLTTLSDNSVGISFTINAITYDGHSVERSMDGALFTEVGTLAFGDNTLTDTGLTSGTLYYYRIRAYRGSLYSGYCAIGSVTTIYLPSDISGLITWNDPSQLTGLNDNDPCASFTDFSGNGNHLTQSDNTRRPLYKTNIINGLPILRSDGSNDFMRKLSVPTSRPITIFIVAAPSNQYQVLALNSGYIVFNNATGKTAINCNSGASLQSLTSDINFGEFVIGTAQLNGANSMARINGGFENTGNVGTNTGDRLHAFSDSTGSVYFSGDVGDIIIYNGALSSANIIRVEEYLSVKYGITLVVIPTDIFTHTEASIIYVSPSGTGDGSTEEEAAPLQAALESGNVIPGDTIMLLDGTYSGNFMSTVTGTSGSPIYIKPQNYMAAIIDGTLQIGDFGGINGAYTIIRNIEATNSDTNRGTWETPQGTISRPPNIFPAAPNVSIINCLYHDGGVGLPGYLEADNLLLYGNIGFNNGWADNVGGGAQNIYIAGTNKTVKHNVFAGAFKKSVAVYTTNGTIENITLEENIIFEKTNLLFGGNHGAVISGSLLRNHVLKNGIVLGYVYTPNETITCSENIVYGDNPITALYFKYLTMNGNKFVGQETSGNGCFEINYTTEKVSYAIDNNEYHNVGAGTPIFHEGTYNGAFAGWQALGHDAGGSYSTNLPATNEIFIYPNEYPDADDMRMGMVVIWNWEELETVDVDLTELGLEIGTTYRWRQAQDPLVDVDTWEDDGNPYTFAMTGHTVAKPIGFDEELIATQFPIFGCFIIEKVS